MTATLSRLPLVAGGALAAAIGRAGLWGIARFARAPMASTGLLVMTTLSVMAASNALYFQKGHHPAPLFKPGVAQQRVAEVSQPAAPALAEPEPVRIAPVVPPAAPKPLPDFASLPDVAAPAITGSVSNSDPAPEKIGNKDVYDVQKKLAEMKLFTGKADGYYGPQTASAIRAFELSVGRQPEGAMTPEVMQAIMRAPVLNPASVQVREPSVQRQQQARIVPASMQAPAAQSSNDQPRLLGRVNESGPELLLDTVGDSAAQTLDNLVSTLQGGDKPAETARPVAGNAQPAMVPPASIKTASTSNGQQRMGTPTSDPAIVGKVQRGLMSLGFLAGSVDGVPGETTAKAIRNFEVYYNYKVTGQVTPELVGMLEQAGAVM